MEWIKQGEVNRNEYIAVHQWLRYKFGKANRCESCNGTRGSIHYEYALKKGCDYIRKIENFLMLCKKCHAEYDGFDNTKLHSYRNSECMGRINKAKLRPIRQFDKRGVFIKEWVSISEAAIGLSISIKAISNVLTNRARTSGGFIWEYKK